MLSSIINKFDFEMEWLDVDVSGKRYSTDIIEYHRPLINVCVSLKEDDSVVYDLENFSFCEKQVVKNLEGKIIQRECVTKVYKDDEDDENEEISNELKEMVLDTIFKDYSLFSTVCNNDTVISNLLALSLELDLDPTECDKAQEIFSNLTLCSKFVSELVDKGIITEKQIEELE